MKFLSSGKPFEKIQSLREQIANTQSKIDALDTEPLPADEALARFQDFIKSSNDDIGMALHLTDWCLFPGVGDSPRGHEGWMVGDNHSSVDLLHEFMRLFASIAPDLVEQSAKTLIDHRLAELPPGPPLADRPAMREELEAKLHDLEVKEEKAIEKLEAGGYLVHRRPDAKPEIILDTTR